MITSLGANFQYAGIATPATDPGTPDQNIFYIASTAGTYVNFGGLVLADGEIAILKYNGAWSKDSTGAASLEKVNQLGSKVGVADLQTVVGKGVNLAPIWTSEKIINGRGAVVDSTAHSASDFIPVEEGKVYYGPLFQSNYAYYDAEFRFIKGFSQLGPITPTTGVTIPQGEGIKYARFSIYTTDITKGWLSDSGYFPPERYQEYIESILGRKFVKPGSIEITDLSFAKHDEETDMIRVFANNGYIDANGNYHYTAGTWSYTDFIELEEGERYYIIGNYAAYTAFYDANKAFVSKDISGWFTVPNGVKYIRVSWNSLSKACYLSKYSGKLPPYGYKLAVGEERPTNYEGSDISVFKKIICIGDSLTQGVFNVNASSPSASSQMQFYNYPLFLKKITGVECSNYGVASATTESWYNAHASLDLSGYDCAIIQLGVNDSGWSNDVKTAYDNIITKLRTENKDIVVFMSTIIRSNSYGNSASEQSYNESLTAYVAERNEPNTILLDMNAYDHLVEGLAYNAGHLTAYGYWRLAADYKAYISWYMHKNRDVFRYVHFIGTNCYYK